MTLEEMVKEIKQMRQEQETVTTMAWAKYRDTQQKLLAVDKSLFYRAWGIVRKEEREQEV